MDWAKRGNKLLIRSLGLFFDSDSFFENEIESKGELTDKEIIESYPVVG